MKHRYYFDTSVFGGVFDKEFSKYSIRLFEQVKSGRVICVYSELVLKELVNAPQRVRGIIEELPKEFTERLPVSAAAEELAKKYISEKVIGESNLDDCRHIAFATLSNANLLISWNFKHIVNERRIPGYNSINLKSGYTEIKIISPKQLLSNENED